MITRVFLTLTILSITLLNGCSYFKYPDIHKVVVQQGNVITQKMVDQLRPGMTRSQVRYIFGTPLLTDTFNQDRWDYYYSLQRPGQKESTKRITIYFKDDQMSHFEGDLKQSKAKPASSPDNKAATD